MKILHIDIETAPHQVYAWQLYDDYVPVDRVIQPGYTLCWAAKWQGKSEVMFDSVHQSSQRQMIKGIHDLLEEADAVAHFNGNKFDIPTLNKEFLLQGLPPPAPAKQIDLYRTVKSRFRFASSSLAFVAQQLGLGKKTPHKGMELWAGCLAGDDASWRTMERYNKQDVKITQRMYNVLRPWIVNHPNFALYVNDDAPICRVCGSDNLHSRGFAKLNAGVYHRYQCQDCSTWGRGAKSILDRTDRARLIRELR